VPLANVVGAVVGLAGAISPPKTDAQKATDFAGSIYADLQAGKPGALSAIQFRARPTYAWMLQADTRPIMLQLVATVIHAGYAKASDFDPSVAQAAGALAAPGTAVPGNAVSPAGTGLSGLLPTGGIPWGLVLLGGAVVVGVWWFLKRRRR
jgi:hypothetical protein